MRRRYRWVAFACLALVSVTNARSEEGPAHRALLKGKLLMKSGMTKWDGDLMRQARDLFELAARDSLYAQWGHYYLGYCHFRLGNYALQAKQHDEARRAFARAAVHLQQALELRDEFAEAQALLAVCMGQQAGLDGWRAVSLAQQCKSMMTQAVKLAPDNPRVRFLQALASYYTPDFLGGSRKQARALLEKASQLFATFQQHDILAPQWGHAECFAWLCEFYSVDDENAPALAACQRALTINPAYRWVKENLLPDLAK